MHTHVYALTVNKIYNFRVYITQIDESTGLLWKGLATVVWTDEKYEEATMTQLIFHGF